jgi:hypothetical protein
MESHMMFLDCPAYLGGGAARCGLPAEVETRYTVSSTDGPLESAKIRCPRGHWFNGPIESLTVPEQPTIAVVSGSPLPPPTVQNGSIPNRPTDARRKS